MKSYRALWITLALVMLGSFAVLGYYGYELYQIKPPVPDQVVSEDGEVVYTRDDIITGQKVWQSFGGQEVGSVWGHGSYVAPDWTADWLHRESVWLLDQLAEQQTGQPYEELGAPQQASLREHLKEHIRANTYDEESDTITVSPLRARAIDAVSEHYLALFGDDPELAELREAYAMPDNTVKDDERRDKLMAFLWWGSWAAGTERPGKDITYTHNWPPEELMGNVATGDLVIWSVLSFILLLAGVGGLVWWYAAENRREREEEEADIVPDQDPLLGMTATPSMQATLKYFWIVSLLIIVQILTGVLTAHYGVEGTALYGFPLADYLPYAVTRSWHTQLAIFWIATAWLATGLFVAPAVSGEEPKGQKLGVNILFWALIVVVAGTLVGQWYSIVAQFESLDMSFWLGHQGYEYIDLGRLWQWLLFVGLFLWLFLMGRALKPALQKRTAGKHLLGLFVLASAAIAVFYGAGFFYGAETNLAMAEYWRWWVVHLWVEGFFEVFATVVIAFLFVRMQLLRTSTATAAVLFSTIIFLFGGIIGTFHHLYFSGTPTAVLALGATFSALEVVPLVLIGFEGYENLTHTRARPWVSEYKWPIYFFVAVAFWNLVGAGLFGFFINPPIALYYLQGLNTTPVHAHTALFGVYGNLGIGLMLFCLRGLTTRRKWRQGPLSFAFWTMNVGLMLMVLLSVLPMGLFQGWAAVEHGMWYARSAEFMQQGIMEVFRWLRVVGDTIFAVGALVLAAFVFGIKTGWSLEGERTPVKPPQDPQTGDDVVDAGDETPGE